MERGSGKGYQGHLDLDRVVARFRLESQIVSRYYGYFHFGILCSSWGSSNTLNGGTRRNECPDRGPDVLDRERVGNDQIA